MVQIPANCLGMLVNPIMRLRQRLAPRAPYRFAKQRTKNVRHLSDSHTLPEQSVLPRGLHARQVLGLRRQQ